MKATARRYGLVPYEINKNLKSVLRELSNDTPVIVLFNLGLKLVPAWHYSVVTGFDKTDKKIFLSAPKGDETWMTFEEFETFFERGGSWAIVALKPPSLPVSADEKEVIGAILDMYDTGAKDIARHASVSYISKNPSSYLGIATLANIYFLDGDFKSASFMYEQALALKPKDPIMLNNFAESLLKQNRLLEAKKYALEAVSIGGTFLQNYKNTLQEIETMLKDEK
jgi:tetratricopeptide (TPR) repeat protein